jgi:DNA repair protein RadC
MGVPKKCGKQEIKEAGKILDIPLLDHLIITSDKYFSFADEGLL